MIASQTTCYLIIYLVHRCIHSSFYVYVNCTLYRQEKEVNSPETENSHDKMRAGLISKITEHIFMLMKGWFPGIVSQEILIPCPYCITCKNHTKPDNPIHLKRSFATNQSLTCALKGGYDEDVSNAFIFSFNECMCASYDSKVIYCPAHGDIPLEYFVPDVVSSTYICI